MLPLLLLLAPLPGRAEEGAAYDEKPQPRFAPPPDYPRELKQKQIGGVVMLLVSINDKGLVDTCAVKKASRPAFEQPAMDAVRKWVFRPARKDGHEVPAEVTLSVVFATE